MAVLDFQTLFSVRIYHRFYLNVGESSFEDLDEASRLRQLLRYDWQDFLSMVPLGSTAKLLRSHQMMTQYSKTHLIVRVRRDSETAQHPFIPVSQDLTLVFGLYYKDPLFENYTQMPFLTDRWMVWCNNLDRYPVSDTHPPIPVDESEVFSPSFLGSASEIQNLCRQLQMPFPMGCKGLFIFSMRGQSGSYNILNGSGTLKQHPTEFFLNFSNRSTNWRYIKPDVAFTAETVDVKPLTRDGYVSIDYDSDFSGSPDWPAERPFPNPGIRFLKQENDKLISEIYL